MTARVPARRIRAPLSAIPRSAGAATVEFSVIALTALIPTVLGILQLGLLYVAKHTVQHATYLAARAGAVEHGSRDAMRQYFAKGLVPLVARSPSDLAAGPSAQAVGRAYAAAFVDASRPDRTRITVVNPRSASFDDFEGRENGTLQIPNRFDRTKVGARSRQTLADANVLRLRIDYCAELIVPFVDRLITSTLQRLDADAFRQQCYAARRLPIVGHATVQMHSAARRGEVQPG